MLGFLFLCLFARPVFGQTALSLDAESYMVGAPMEVRCGISEADQSIISLTLHPVTSDPEAKVVRQKVRLETERPNGGVCDVIRAPSQPGRYAITASTIPETTLSGKQVQIVVTPIEATEGAITLLGTTIEAQEDGGRERYRAALFLSEDRCFPGDFGNPRGTSIAVVDRHSGFVKSEDTFWFTGCADCGASPIETRCHRSGVYELDGFVPGDDTPGRWELALITKPKDGTACPEGCYPTPDPLDSENVTILASVPLRTSHAEPELIGAIRFERVIDGAWQPVARVRVGDRVRVVANDPNGPETRVLKLRVLLSDYELEMTRTGNQLRSLPFLVVDGYE